MPEKVGYKHRHLEGSISRLAWHVLIYGRHGKINITEIFRQLILFSCDQFLVQAVEVRDKIQASDVNKFLVKLVDKQHPEQSSAYMAMLTGVFWRPQYLPHRFVL